MDVTLAIPGTIGATNWIARCTLGAKNEAARAKTISALYAQIHHVMNEMAAAGFPRGLIMTYAMAQIMLESDWMTSNVANTDNNYTGIKYLDKSYQKATKGLPSPEGGYYAHFATFADWVRDYIRILSLNTGGKGTPITATTAQQFFERLLANHYFTDPAYSTKFNAALRKVNEAIIWGNEQNKKFLEQRESGQDTFTYTPGKGLTSNAAFDFDKWITTKSHWVKDHPAESVLVALASIFTLKKIFE